MSRKSIIEPIQGLRCLAFLGIFIEHCGINALGCWCVSVFFVMSGFLNGIKKSDQNVYSLRIGEKIGGVFRKIKKLYPLHIVTLVLSIVVYYIVLNSRVVRNVFLFIIQFVANIGLFQSLIPRSDCYFAFNSVSWYLSTYVFILIIFSFFEPFLARKRSNKKLLIIAAILIFIEIVISTILLFVGDNIPTIVSDDIVKWITYISPFYRFFDYSIAFIMGRIFINKSTSILSVKQICFLQMFAFALIPFLQIIYYNGVNNSIMDPFRYSLLFLPDAIILVLACAFDKGPISDFLSNKMFLFIGKISGYAFLIHQLVIVFFKELGALLVIPSTVIYLVSFVITIIISHMYFKNINGGTE